MAAVPRYFKEVTGSFEITGDANSADLAQRGMFQFAVYLPIQKLTFEGNRGVAEN